MDTTQGQILVIGATGFVGGHLARHLVATGHQVSGLARTDAAADGLASEGITPVRGDLDHPEHLLADEIDTVVFAPALDIDVEGDVVAHLLEHMATDSTFVFVSGTGVLLQRSHGKRTGLTFAEDDPFDPEPLALRRVQTERLVREADKVRGIVLRPPEIWGPGDRSRVESIRQSVVTTQQAGYVGEGSNVYSFVTAAGLGDLLVRALEKAPAGALYHAVEGEVSNAEIAHEVADALGVTTRSVDEAEAKEIWGPFGALLMSADSSTVSPRAEAELGWRPAPVDLRAAVRARLGLDQENKGKTMITTDWVPEGFVVRNHTVSGTRYSVAVGGHGPTVVLLHGWPQTSRAWRKVMPELARTHTVVVPDLLGAGNTDVADVGYTKVEQAAALGDLLVGLGLPRRAHVVGHDIGAMVALAWAADRPQEVASLTVVDATFPGIGLEKVVAESNGAMWHFAFFAAPNPIPEMLFDGHELEFFTLTFRAISNPDTFSDDDLAYYADAYRGRERLRGGFEQYRAFARDGQDFQRLLGSRRLTMPVLAVGGGARMGDTVAAELAPYADALRGEVAPTGHFVAEEDPEWLLGVLRGVLGVD